MKEISVRQMLYEVNNTSNVFSIGYWKDNGKFGFKQHCVRLHSNNNLNERKKMNRSGLLKILIPQTGEQRDITIDLIAEYNGQTINHEL